MKYDGIITPMLTPFKQEGSADLDATDRLVEYLKGIGVSGLFPLGSTGLFPYLFSEERVNYLQHVNDVKGNLKVFAGIGSSNTEECVKFGRNAADIGCDILVLMPTYYIHPSHDEIYRHFSTVLDKVDKDFFIYNIPQLSGEFIPIDVVEKLKEEYSHVVGLKESSGDMRYFSKLLPLSGKNFSIFNGQDDLLLPSLALGADGGVCGLSNFNPLIVKVYQEYRNGEIQKAQETQMKANSLMRAINAPNFPSGYYYAFYQKMGIQGGYRTPMLEPSEAAKEVIRTAMDE
jgi:4-hydroxy-tetrahydrodipicolinate synthase/2-dehydro-3-deoxy-D-gluconate aldolase